MGLELNLIIDVSFLSYFARIIGLFVIFYSFIDIYGSWMDWLGIIIPLVECWSLIFYSIHFCFYQFFKINLDGRFIRSEEDDMDPSWEQRLVKRYYAKLFKEYPFWNIYLLILLAKKVKFLYCVSLIPFLNNWWILKNYVYYVFNLEYLLSTWSSFFIVILAVMCTNFMGKLGFWGWFYRKWGPFFP